MGSEGTGAGGGAADRRKDPRHAAGLACPICRHGGARVVMRGRAWRILRCPSCGIARTDPPPPSSRAAPLSPAYRKRARLFARYMDHLLDILGSEIGGLRGKRLLDIGCGPGILLERARRRGLEAEGIEPAAEAAAAARAKGFAVLERGIEEAGIPPRSADAVLFSASLEHLPDPLGALGKAREALRPGGRVIAEVPNFDALLRRLLGPRWPALHIEAHRWHFTPAALEGLIERAGLRVARLFAYEPRAPLARTPRGVLRHLALLPARAAGALMGAGSSLIAVGAPPEAPARPRRRPPGRPGSAARRSRSRAAGECR